MKEITSSITASKGLVETKLRYACSVCLYLEFYGIIIVCWGPMIMAFQDKPCPWIVIPTDLYTIICLKIIKVNLNTLPKTLRPH